MDERSDEADTSRSESDAGSLGFTWRASRSGEVVVARHGRPVTTLRGRAASEFLAVAASADAAAIQQRLARLTGNYRRGNERAARSHPRNR